MTQFVDQTGRKIQLRDIPQRIVSTVPSQTELLHYLDLGDRVVGITGYCVHPAQWRTSKTVIGGTKDLSIDRIKELKPDLIIGNKEENVRGQIEELATEFPVWLSDIRTVDQALNMIAEVGRITHTEERSQLLLHSLQEEIKSFKPSERKLRTAYFIWKDPYMLAGADTFINSLLELAGFQNCVPSASSRYPEVNMEEVVEAQPEVILLSSEPYAFSTADLQEVAGRFEHALVKLVNGELTWYGSRMLKTLPYLVRMQKESFLVSGIMSD